MKGAVKKADMIGRITVTRWGGSLGVRIPKYVIDDLEIRKGTKLKVSYTENSVTFTTGPTRREQFEAFALEWSMNASDDDL